MIDRARFDSAQDALKITFKGNDEGSIKTTQTQCERTIRYITNWYKLHSTIITESLACQLIRDTVFRKQCKEWYIWETQERNIQLITLKQIIFWLREHWGNRYHFKRQLRHLFNYIPSEETRKYRYYDIHKNLEKDIQELESALALTHLPDVILQQYKVNNDSCY